MIAELKLISFSGKQGCGKSFLANYCKIKAGYEIISLSDSLKRMICESININLTELNNNKNIVRDIPYKLDYDIVYKHTNIPKNILHDTLNNKKFYTIREILQYVGTDVIRKYQSDWHINKTIKKIYKIQLKNPNKITKICIDDVRFKNEMEFIKNLGGECYYIINRNNNNDNILESLKEHISENELNENMFHDNKILINNQDESFKKYIYCI